ncbi:MAG TPA: RNA polymerase sigma-I factor [Clostridia bacterium]|nr:RNA polymerase sigma-I factor [Clostridia bacterium]
MRLLSRKNASTLAQIDFDQLLIRAQSGDVQVREDLLNRFSPFVLKTCSQVSGRYISREDDEFSLSLLAFNQAIDQYDRTRGSSFLSFAELLIRRRLIDYFRKEGKHKKTLPFSSLVRDDLDEDSIVLEKITSEEAINHYLEGEEIRERQEEINSFVEALGSFGIALEEIVQICPKHRDARERALEVAKIIIDHAEMKKHVLEKKELPLKDLESLVQVSRKTLERQRKYILALVVALSGQYPYLKSYLNG